MRETPRLFWLGWDTKLRTSGPYCAGTVNRTFQPLDLSPEPAYIRSMKNELPMTTLDRLTDRMAANRQKQEVAEVRKGQRRVALLAALVTVPVAGLVALSSVTPAPSPQAPAAVAAAPVPAAVTAAEARKLAQCAKDNVEAAICDRYLEALAQIEDSQNGDSYRDHLDRQAQRDNDLAYCRQNPADWSCTDGQYRGQY